MVAYNFPHHMARAIIFGQKASCLKPNGKRNHVAVDGTVTAVVGMVPPDWSKSDDFHRLIDAPCTRSEPVKLDDPGMFISGVLQTNPEWYRVCAEAEGYSDFTSLQADYKRRFGFPWEGQYVRWNPDKATFRAQWPLIEKPPPEPPPVEAETTN